jgi:hypothetical protein
MLLMFYTSLAPGGRQWGEGGVLEKEHPLITNAGWLLMKVGRLLTNDCHRFEKEEWERID